MYIQHILFIMYFDLMYYPTLLEKFYDVKEERTNDLGYSHMSK